MNLKKSINSILILTGVLFSLSFPGISAESRQSEDAKSIVALVSSAAALVENKGKDSFAEFRKKDSKWFTAKTYVFAADDLGENALGGPDLLLPAFIRDQPSENIGADVLLFFGQLTITAASLDCRESMPERIGIAWRSAMSFFAGHLEYSNRSREEFLMVKERTCSTHSA